VSETEDRRLALQLAHEAEGCSGVHAVPIDAERIVARAEAYLAFLRPHDHALKNHEKVGVVEWVG
jgi:hypothetical protein